MNTLKWVFFAVGLATELGIWIAKSLGDKKLTIREGFELIKIGLKKAGVPTQINVAAYSTMLNSIVDILAVVIEWLRSALKDEVLDLDEAVDGIEQGCLVAGVTPEIDWSDSKVA